MFPADLCLSAFKYSPTINLAIRRPALSLNTVSRSTGVSLRMEGLLEGVREDMLVAERGDLEVRSCGEKSPRQRRLDVKP